MTTLARKDEIQEREGKEMFLLDIIAENIHGTKKNTELDEFLKKLNQDEKDVRQNPAIKDIERNWQNGQTLRMFAEIVTQWRL